MNDKTEGLILVTGATGTQGGAAVRALLKEGFGVRAFVRDATSAGAATLAGFGAEVFQGDYENVPSLEDAMDGVRGVFSVQMPPHPNDPDREVRTGLRLLEAAFFADVDMYVHTSVARAGDHEQFVDWDSGRWWKRYWESKAEVNDAVSQRGLKHWVILKPAHIMENFLPPKAHGMYPSFVRGKLETAILPETRLDMVAAADIGAFAVAAFKDPARFNGHSIDLAGESLTMDEVTSKLSSGTGREVRAQSLTEGEALAHGISAGVISSQIWDNVEGYKVDIETARKWGVQLTAFEKWVEKNRDQLLEVMSEPNRG
ncbi:MAG: NmrA/HSCARG family protein [Pseudomonas sp.]|uniref:NmrA/HSCARG family protein n=1 Tax=Pseudomonas sp. TaxID=306 RepID=UPI003D6F5861